MFRDLTDLYLFASPFMLNLNEVAHWLLVTRIEEPRSLKALSSEMRLVLSAGLMLSLASLRVELT